MPTYDYKCENEHEYAENRSMNDDPIRTTCPEPDCGLPLKRVFNVSGVSFQGEGFYSNSERRNFGL
jgi:putative FmdB family regulatory protein